MKKGSWLLVFLLPLFLSCGGYEKLLKGTDSNLKYKKAFEYYNKGDYARAGTLFEQIASFFRGTTKADSVYFFQAMTYFKQNDFILAGHTFKTFSDTYGNSPFAEEATYYVGYCFYLTSPRPELDQTDTYQAIQSLRLFMIRYPNSTRKEQCEKMIAEMRDKLVEKSFISARLYFDLEDYKASIVALNNSLDEYPESRYREDILFLIVKSNYMLALNSIQSKQKERFQSTIDEYYSFITEFPDSKYRKDADRIFESSSRYLSSEETTLNEINIKQ
ncbi:MAG TPA: outer membrane protein assembly factor BamD [Bacteroidales bacterium]|nr:outer membrane protein assembly factor BamD [Bacteroidales bacterium]